MPADQKTTDQAKAIELKPCPFCGAEAVIETRQDEDLWSHDIVTWTGIRCPACELVFDWPPGADPDAATRWNTRAVSISRTSQGSGVWAEEDVERVARAFCCPNGCAVGDHTCVALAYVPEAQAGIAVMAALSPPATPQASEDVTLKAYMALCELDDDASNTQRAETLSRAHLLATPVTVTMEECREIVILTDAMVDSGDSADMDLANALRRVLGDRIQISGEQS